MEIQSLKDKLVILLMLKSSFCHKTTRFLVTQHGHRQVNTNLYFWFM